MKQLKKLHLKGANELSEAEMKQVFGGSGTTVTLLCKCFTLTPDGSGILKESQQFEAEGKDYADALSEAGTRCKEDYEAFTCS